MQIDVFTQVPHAFAWMTEQRPVAAVLGTELDLRLFNYRDTTPLRAGQVDDEPYGGGAGMVLRVDVVAAALDAVYGGAPEQRVIALTPQGRQLTQAVVEELAAEGRLTLLSSRFEGFDERIVTHLCSDAISIGPYVLSGGELPAMVLLDAIVRRLPGALAEGSGEHESFSVELEGGIEYPHYTRPAEFRGLLRAGRAALRRSRPGCRLAPRAEPRAERRWTSTEPSATVGIAAQPSPYASPPPAAAEESVPLALPLVAGVAAALAGGSVARSHSKRTDTRSASSLGDRILTGFAVHHHAARRAPSLPGGRCRRSLLGSCSDSTSASRSSCQESNAAFGADIGLFSGEIVQLFRESLGEVYGSTDVLWTGLAVGHCVGSRCVRARRMPSRSPRRSVRSRRPSSHPSRRTTRATRSTG